MTARVRAWVRHPSPSAVLIGLAVLLTVSLLVRWVSVVHETRRLRQDLCAAQVEAWLAQSRLSARFFVLPQDPCLALDVLRGHE